MYTLWRHLSIEWASCLQGEKSEKSDSEEEVESSSSEEESVEEVEEEVTESSSSEEEVDTKKNLSSKSVKRWWRHLLENYEVQVSKKCNGVPRKKKKNYVRGENVTHSHHSCTHILMQQQVQCNECSMYFARKHS